MMNENEADNKIEIEKTVLREGLEAQSDACQSLVPEEESNIVNHTSAHPDDVYKSAVISNARKARARDPRFKMYDFDINPEHPWYLSLAISLFLFVMAGLMCLFLYSSVVCWPWQQEWIPVGGQVTGISNHRKNSAKFTYSYKVDNQTLSGAMYKPGSLEHTVKVGSKITVRYNPRRTAESYMQGGFNVIETPFYAILSLAFFACGLFYSTSAIMRGLRKQ